MPLIRCPKCGQAYDVPGAVAVRLPNSITTCHCGEWLSGSKAAVLARMVNPEDIREIDLQPYRVERSDEAPRPAAESAIELEAVPRSIRVVARGVKESLDRVFTISSHPLWIGRKGCHIELADSELDIRHCSISLHGSELVLRDAESHTGTYLDGEQIDEAAIADGVHVVRVGTAMVTLEPVAEAGELVEPVELKTNEILSDSAAVEALRARARQADEAREKRLMLVCIDGALNGQEFEIPATGLIVGREGHVRVPDEFLSRKHFEVVVEPDGTIRVRDLGSRNGTFLNTLPARNTKVQSGDEIRAGVNRFRVELR